VNKKDNDNEKKMKKLLNKWTEEVSSMSGKDADDVNSKQEMMNHYIKV
jgi:hypothetical protein